MAGTTMLGETKDVGNPNDYKFLDPTGASANATALANQNLSTYGAGVQNFNPNAYMEQFLAQAPGLSNLVTGQNSQLAQTLNAIAAQQARSGGELALAAMPGMRNSGAASAAFGEAYANPFAQAQAQLQQNQLQGTLGLWNNAMQQNAGGQNSRLNAYANLAAASQNNLTDLAVNQSAWYQPTYQKQPGWLDYGLQGAAAYGDILGAIGNIAIAAGGSGG